MTLLAIDTSEQTCSAALVEAGQVLGATSEHIGRGHAERLLPLIGELLALYGQTYADITRIAVTTGPGTFTGLRIGLSVARGLALQGDIPCVGLTGLQVLAAQAQAHEKSLGQPVHALIAGRGGQAFFQSFSGQTETGLPRPMAPPRGLDVDKIAEIVAAQGGLLAGSGVALLKSRNLLTEKLLSMSLDTAGAIDPATLGLLGENLDPADYPPEPTYYREADAAKATAALPVARPGQSS